MLGVFAMIRILALLVPSIAVSVLRLLDRACSGWWSLIGFIVLLVLFFMEGSAGDDRFGLNPKESPA